jgi:hypothetical protein
MVMLHLEIKGLGQTKSPKARHLGAVRAQTAPKKGRFTFTFSHPDYTVGPGMSPGLRLIISDARGLGPCGAIPPVEK